ncbi:hypothetical protein F503_04737 [Ophiostoma piceae UAMH 11346]|uniref:Ribosome biogenesis protein SLX9 n=1 Tax=Ophiostoma piceae (strain UAMH 11346) TaxID=1262450 RepID=S3BUT1_OPHP1|nr:hypothetical protein F503_04737 [Ophiostoma piceae UAMH 11346]
MAPVAPTQKMSHRAKALARIADPTLPRKVHREDNTVTDDFLHSKRDKQTIRKASFRARVTEKLADRGRLPGKKELKRRRPSKKLVATLESLADALPEVASGTAEDDETKRRRRQTSLKTRPGSMKRKEKVVQAEMARFGLNLAQLTAVKEDAVAPVAGGMELEAAAEPKTDDKTDAAPKQSTANRFAMLRNYITATMDQSPAFAKQE